MANGNLVKVDVIDQNGKSCDTSFFCVSTVHDPADSGIQAIITALNLIIDGGIVQNMVELVDDTQVAGLGTNVGYNAADKIHCVLRSTVDGSTSIIDIPAPAGEDSTSVDLFNLDGTVNQSCPAIAALISFLNAHSLDTNGGANVFVSGKRTRSERLRTAF